MKTNLLIIILIVFSFHAAFSQNVAINNDGSQANNDAILHLKSTNKGLLIPTMNTSQRNNISNISDGILVYDTQTNSFWFRDNGTWHELLTDSYSPAIPDEIKDSDGNTKIQVEQNSNDDEIRFDIDGKEYLTLEENPNGLFTMNISGNYFNTFLGDHAGESTNPSAFPNGRWNTFLGHEAGRDNRTGYSNCYVGREAGRDNIAGRLNTYVGNRAASNNGSGDQNVCIGSSSAASMSSGDNNVIVGYNAGGNLANSTSNNVLIGAEAGLNLGPISSSNVMIGYRAGNYLSGIIANRLVIDNSGTSNPLIEGDFGLNRLAVNADFTVNGLGSALGDGRLFFSESNDRKYSLDFDRSNNHFVIRDEVNNDNVFYIEDGKIGIQRTNPSNTLEIGGTASKSSAGDWLANSDARLKKNITALDENAVLKKLLQLQGITYEWNDSRPDYKRPEGVQYGFTAQNIQQVFPEFVSEDNEGYLQTAYGTYDAMYIEAIRALVQRIEALESQVNDLQARTGK